MHLLDEFLTTTGPITSLENVYVWGHQMRILNFD